LEREKLRQREIELEHRAELARLEEKRRHDEMQIEFLKK